VSARSFAVFMSVLAVIALLAFGLASKGEARLEVGEQVPSSELRVLGAADRTGSLADYRGKWVLVNVWASWCGPCRDEAPELQAFYDRHRGPDFEILGIDTQETGQGGLDFVAEFELEYPQLHDGDGNYAKEELKTTGVPETFLVDPDGNLLFYNESAEAILGQRFEETGAMPAARWSSAFAPVDDQGQPLAPEALPLMITLARRRPAHRSFHIRGMNGVLRHIEVASIPIVGLNGEFLGAAAFFWEIDEPCA